jgi:aminoglycoside phosphotransferase (APT) family kinase protein
MDESAPGVDPRGLREFFHRTLAGTFPDAAIGTLTARLIAGGRSNLTYVVSDGTRDWVLRRPPLGHVLATAHDMGREYRVMTALAGTRVPVPRTYVLCDDPAVLGAPFYLMERVHGTVHRSPDELDPGRAAAISASLVDVLADLHAVDPADVGLSDFGRPDGFLERQVRRWGKQLDASRSRDLVGAAELREALAASVPVTQGHAIVHGDYKLDNLMIGAADGVVAVLDWEMATLGDPLCDVGLLHVYWDLAESPVMPPVRDVLDRYAARSCRDLSPLPWYQALGCFKLAVISEGIHYRFLRGQTVGEGFETIGDRVEPLIAHGRELLA